MTFYGVMGGAGDDPDVIRAIYPPERVQVKAVVDLTVHRTLRHLCPFKEELDEGRIKLELSTAGGWTTELHALDEYLAAWVDIEISHEELTDRIAVDTQAIRVTTYWRTAGMEVSCSTSPTPAGTL